MATLQRNLKLKPNWLSDAIKNKHRLTSIVCTIGPKTKEVEMLVKLLEAGMDVMRLNFSHGSHEYHAECIKNLREALELCPSKRCAIMLDTKGPEIRTGKLKDKTLKLERGQEINVITDLNAVGDEEKIIIDYQDLVNSVQPDGLILIADGTIMLNIISVDKQKNVVRCRVNNSAVLGENKNVHLPGAKITLPAVSEKDKLDLQFGVEQGVDFVAASFIRSPDDIREIRQILGERGKHIKIIAKIESTEGLDNFRKIVHETDGVMVARGDLGVELPTEQIFMAQKMMISVCNALNKPVITATQMLESMIQNPRPTRAEATDVANAVLDGTDCVMLSGETASGNYPLEAVACMSLICKEAEHVESIADYPTLFEALRHESLSSPNPVPEVVCSYAVRISQDLNASVIIVLTESGLTARLVAKYRPKTPIICVTNSNVTANYLLLTRGCVPMLVKSMHGTDNLIMEAIAYAKKMNLVDEGSLVVIVHGTIEGNRGGSNLVKVENVRSLVKRRSSGESSSWGAFAQ